MAHVGEDATRIEAVRWNRSKPAGHINRAVWALCVPLASQDNTASLMRVVLS